MSGKKFAISVTAVCLIALFAVSSASAATYSYSGNILAEPQYDLYTVTLFAGEQVTATLVCDEVAPGDRPLDPVLSVYFPGVDTSNTINANVYNDDGFGLDDDAAGVDCNAFDSSRVQFTAPSAGVYTLRADGFGSATGPYTLRIVTGATGSADGRINPQNDAPVVLYCSGTSTNFYSVTGVFLGSVAAGGSGAFGSANVSPTADGRMQALAPLPDGKAYLFIWSGCPRGSYEAYSVQGGTATLYASGSY